MIQLKRRSFQFVFVWTMALLLIVDPASACRLLRSRRGCTCCGPAPTCEGGLPTTTDEPADERHVDNQPMPSPPSDRNAPPEPGEAPAAIVPPAASLAPAISADAETARPIETLATQPGPAANDVFPKQSTTTANVPASSAPSAPQRLSIEPARPATATPPAAVPSIPNSSVPLTPRAAPAPSAAPKPMAPVTPPAFPPVDDDPFAPAPTSGVKKRANAAPAVERTPVDDDPFAPLPSSPPATTSRPKAAAPTALSPKDNLTDPLRLGADGRLLVREWTDSSGAFRVTGRLVLLLEGKVRLLKETGRTTTVPVERLSAADRAYVAKIVTRYGTDLEQLDQLAAR